MELWIGTLSNGIIKYDKVLDTMVEYRKFNRNGPPDDRIFDIELFGDEVWVGTFNGIGYFDRNEWKTYNKYDGLPADDVVVLAVTQNNVWVGTSKNGIGLYDKINDTWTKITKEQLPANFTIGKSINSIVAGHDTVWFGWKSEFEAGYCVYNMLNGEWKCSPPFVDELQENIAIYLAMGEDEIWLCTHDGAFWGPLMAGGGWNVIDYPKTFGNDMKVQCIELSGSEAWIGTTKGLGRVDGSLLAR